jgi:hypothetical protein
MKTKYQCTEPDCIGECEPFVCLDCGVNTTHINEYYMLEDDVWYGALTAQDNNGMLCIGCFENRLGRKLRPDDFAQVPLNFAFQGPFQSQRLASRIHSPI